MNNKDRNKGQCSNKIMRKNPIDALRSVDSHF